jgi:hypothetical protein
MKAELGVMRVLANRGKVYLPNYSGNGKSLDDELRWDTEYGIDMGLVVPTELGKVMFLVDAKGQYTYPNGDALHRSGKRIQADFLSEPLSRKNEQNLPLSLRNFIYDQDPLLINRAKIIIPTGEENLMSLKDAYQEWEGDKKETLAHFAEVSQDVEDRILMSVDKLTSDIAIAA